ncbi:hypothetical protein NCCP2331_12870 [Sporosarcina sp. NCCP-2331]|nr:transposase [Sporosarcina sp. NCCP-2378]GKV65134.1 hypothetical protein NCCP2331_12870 [Sporosarcina sp. NCCP-2331]GLB55258.1 hypothetical protein NCCP2378_10440 [Sporosarcina sp. NCCP-2378]
MGGWLAQDIDFLVRVRKSFRYKFLDYEAPTEGNVQQFDMVSIQTRPEKLRLIRFTYHEGTTFILLTNRLDLTENEIMELYKNRWYIELFFMWLKQHVKLDHMRSHSPKGIWDQLLIALITVGLTEIMRVEKELTSQTAWEFHRLIQLYLLDPWERVVEELNREKKPSKGRQKSRDSPKKELDYGKNFAIVDPISKERFL